MNNLEHRKRSLAKTLGFHALVILADAIVVYIITGKYSVTLSVVIFTNLASGIIYFWHERAWNRVHWGNNKVEIELK